LFLVQENVALIREINDLRREIKILKHAGMKPGAGIGAAWGGSKAPRRSTKEAKETLPPPPGSVLMLWHVHALHVMAK
jgi:hypothetical protein